MADTQRSLAALRLLLADNVTGAISEQDLRDFLESMRDPHGQLYISTPAATTVSGAGTFVKAAGVTTLESSPYLFDMPADNRLRYTGLVSTHVNVMASLSFSLSTGHRDVISAAIYKNGTLIPGTTITTDSAPSAGVQRNMAIFGNTEMAPNDYLEVWVTDETDTDSITLGKMMLLASSLFDG